MKRKIYIYTCMDCDSEWESSYGKDTICPYCHGGDLHIEEEKEDDENER